MKFKQPDNGILVVEKVQIRSGLYIPRIEGQNSGSTLCVVVSESDYQNRIFSIRDKDIYRGVFGENTLFLAREEVLNLEVIPEGTEVVEEYVEFHKYYGIEDGNVIYTGNGIVEV